MIGLMMLIALLIWGAISVAVAIWIGRRIPQQGLRQIVALLLMPVVLLMPLADEIVGKFQFDKLCKAAEAITIYKTVSVGADLYTSKGEWRLDRLANKHGRAALHERSELSKKVEQLLHYEGDRMEIPAAIPIYGRRVRIYSRRTDDLLATYYVYSTPGGWLSRNFEKPAIVRAQCLPPERIGLEKRLFTFNGQLSSGVEE